MTDDSGAGTRVGVWKDILLPSSETFILNQLSALERWTPILVGLKRDRDGLPVTPDRVVWPDWLPDRGMRVAGMAVPLDLRLRRYIRDAGLGVMHAHFLTGGAQIVPIVRRLNIPLVVTGHGYDVTALPHKQHALGTWYRKRLRNLIDYAYRFVAVSDFIAERLHSLGVPGGKIEVLPIGIPTDRDRPPSPDRRGIVFVGRLVEKKGVEDLLRALAMIPPVLTRELPIRVVGDGPLLGSLRGMSNQLGLRVEFLGRRSPEDVSAVLASGSLFVGPSRTAENGDSEGFGMVFLEAALHGLPVVAYRHGGVPSAVIDGRTGLLAPEGDVQALADCIAHLLSDHEVGNRLGQEGRRRVLAEYNIVQCTRRLEALYDRAAASVEC